MYSEIISQNYHAAHNISHITSENFLIHSHDFYELHYFVSGHIRYLFSGTEYIPRQHTLMIFPPNLFHGVHVCSEEPYDRHTLHFTAELLPREYRELLMGSLPTEESIRSGVRTIPYMIENADQLELLPHFEEYQKLAGTPEEIQKCLVSALTQLLLSKLLVYSSAQVPMSAEHIRQGASPELESILSYINQNLTQKLSLDILTRQFYISKSKLNALFHKRLNCTAMEYITRRRLNYSQQLLINGFSAAQAGAASGFGDYTSFYRAYSKYMGYSPAKENRPNPAASMNFSLQDQTDGKASMRSGTKEPNIWDIHGFMSATAVDISILRDNTASLLSK